MLIALTFVLGIANFALHKAVLESGHDLLERTAGGLMRKAGRFALLVEFFVLVAALAFAFQDAGWALAAYAIYTAANGLAAWLILNRKL